MRGEVASRANFDKHVTGGESYVRVRLSLAEFVQLEPRTLFYSVCKKHPESNTNCKLHSLVLWKEVELNLATLDDVPIQLPAVVSSTQSGFILLFNIISSSSIRFVS